MRERHGENAACALRCLWDHSYFWQAFSDRSVSVAWLRGRASHLSKPTVLCVGGTIWVADASRLGGKAQLGFVAESHGLPVLSLSIVYLLLPLWCTIFV